VILVSEVKSVQGRSSVRRGVQFQRACAHVIRGLGFPHADHSGTGAPTAYSRKGDISGVGDRVVECTVQPMENLAGKLRQAEADAIRNGYREYFVMKKAVREPVERAYVVTRAEVLFPLLARLERLERLEDELLGQLSRYQDMQERV